MGVVSGEGTAYPSGAPEFTPRFSWVHVAQVRIWNVCSSQLNYLGQFAIAINGLRAHKRPE
jgi:hypothetical protein